MSNLILYTTEEGRGQAKLRAKDETVWLSQREMAELLDVSPDNVGYFDEMLARIRDIRASEKRFYQKVRDLFALAADCDQSDATTQPFFCHGAKPAALRGDPKSRRRSKELATMLKSRS